LFFRKEGWIANLNKTEDCKRGDEEGGMLKRKGGAKLNTFKHSGEKDISPREL